jgi:hypothetical protein
MSNAVLSENFRQRVRELTIKRRNAGAVAHDLSATWWPCNTNNDPNQAVLLEAGGFFL